MKIVILTRDLPPTVCGIGDQSTLLAQQLQARGHRVALLAGTGAPAPDRTIVERFWVPERMQELAKAIQALQPDHVVLEYTPLTFALEGRYPNPALAQFWARLGRQCRTTLVLHETYFRAWWHPPSWVTGPVQKWQMRRLVRDSHRVLTASQPLLDEVRRWSDRTRFGLLPLGTAIPVGPADRTALRNRHGIDAAERVLTLFGGGESLRRMAGHVEAVEAEFAARRLPLRWLMLGGIPAGWFALRRPVVRPGFLDVRDLSAHLQASDLFLVPHLSGLCAKRSALIAALAHGLPVVGTRGPYTDDFWGDVAGVTLLHRWPRRAFARATADLAGNEPLLQKQGRANRELFESRFAWDRVVEAFLDDAA